MTRLTGKTALVTGASRGIGRAIALRLAGDGATVAVHFGEREDAAKDTVAEIERHGGSAFAVRAKLGSDDAVGALFDGLAAGLGERPLDILVNNAAYGDLAALFQGSIEAVTARQIDEVFAVNVTAPLLIIQRALQLMPDGGRIVSVSSVSARMAAPFQLAYGMSKGAIEVMTRALAHELGARGITVNAVAPGATDSNINAALQDPDLRERLSELSALRRIGRPEEIADAVGFLASDDARWITANIVDASGGAFLGPIQ
ncbi:SDR family NAD(P)-dependent oxidoreductase [Jiangella endophytica]|uniref:SDR family NAD(P)-dependent oxidoreductase n=1 Tax=Jiangella endophytica TaxID=1623398 RepID=UPI000E34E462|nr:SDR family oxidoreductase [Jiangella endophytica]